MDVSPLGGLSVLPAEIRHLIWQYVFYQPEKPHENKLAVLRVNQALHNEVSSSFYDSMILKITIHPWDSKWMTMWASNLDLSLQLKSYNDAKRHGFQRIPWNQVRLIIDLSAPKDLSELSRLRTRVGEFIHLIKKAKSIKYLQITFQDKWHETVQESHYHQMTDLDVVFLPFCRLQQPVNYLKVVLTPLPKSIINANFVPQACRFILKRPLYTHGAEQRQIAERLMDIRTFMAETRGHLDGLLAIEKEREDAFQLEQRRRALIFLAGLI